MPLNPLVKRELVVRHLLHDCRRRFDLMVLQILLVSHAGFGKCKLVGVVDVLRGDIVAVRG